MGAPPSRAARLEALLDLALDTEPTQREHALAAACTDDPALLAEARALVAALERSGEFLQRPAAALLGLSDSPPPETRTGESIGSWRLGRELGRGGMGTVWLAERESGGFQQQAALKLVRGGARSAEVLRRFLAERQILAQLQHPNLARLIDGGTTADGEHWFAMEYVDGVRLTDWCDKRRATTEERLETFLQVAEAARYAHRNLVVHRDIKPSNILVTADGTVKLLDFGIAKLLGADTAPGETATALWVMTPEYASPEQVRGEPITTATDVYALGAVLYELLCGHRAHRLTRLTPTEVERAVCDVVPPRMSEVVHQPVTMGVEHASAGELAARRGSDPQRLTRQLAGDLDTIVARALQKDPARRYPSVDALLEDLHRYRTGRPVLARPDTAWYRLRKFVRRHVAGVSAGFAMFLALAGGLATTLWQARIARLESRKARETSAFVIGLFKGANPEESGQREVTLRDLVDRGVRRVDSALAAQPEVQSEMYGVLGETYRELGLLQQADSLFRRAVSLAERVLGPESAAFADRLGNLGTTLNALGDYEGADSVLARALALQRRLHGPRSPEVGLTLGEYANNLQDLGEYDRAIAAHRDGIAIDRATFGDTSLTVATDLDNLGVTLTDAGQLQAADSANRSSLAIRQRQLPPGHTLILNSLGNLSVTQSKLGNAVVAESLARIVLDGRKRLLPPGHRDLAYALEAVAVPLEHQGRLAEAEVLTREALNIRRTALGPGHAVTMISANNLAVLFVRQGKYDSAAAVFDEVVRRWSSDYGPSDARTGTAINNLGVARMGAGQFRAAERDLARAFTVRRAALGDTAVDVAVTRRNRAALFSRVGRLTEAEREVREALSTLERALPADHPRLAEAWTTLAEVYLSRGRAADADSLLRRARAVQAARLPGFDQRRAETAVLLGRAQFALGMLPAAELLLVEGARGYARYPALAAQTRAAEALLARVRAARLVEAR
ncbi:MAG: serine/threonine protein kinase [Gemmatimonadaceae bacterium]|nr:serine/threonine protein kinase [Gemmatimonadaceae bacterium]